MTYQDSRAKIEQMRKQMETLRNEMHAVQAKIAPQPVEDYAFTTSDGHAKRLSDLFGDKDTLFVIHNMGRGCSSCTMWADGFNGVYDHLRNRAAFVLASPETPEQQKELAGSCGWTFPMISYVGNSFAEDMGYRPEGRAMPGVSVFQRKDGGVVRVSDAPFGPGDGFCVVWSLFDLIPEGANGWQPKFRYAS